MEHKEENLQEEQGSMQRQTQQNEQLKQGESDQKDEGPVGIVPASEVKGSDADKDRGGEPSLEEVETKNDSDELRYEKPRRSSWNSITFDNDDFVSGLMPA